MPEQGKPTRKIGARSAGASGGVGVQVASQSGVKARPQGLDQAREKGAVDGQRRLAFAQETVAGDEGGVCLLVTGELVQQHAALEGGGGALLRRAGVGGQGGEVRQARAGSPERRAARAAVTVARACAG